MKPENWPVFSKTEKGYEYEIGTDVCIETECCCCHANYVFITKQDLKDMLKLIEENEK